MIETNGDIWNYYNDGYWVCIPTNGNTKKDNTAIMGKGLALQASIKIPELPRILGQRINLYKDTPYKGNKLNPFPDIHLFCFPTKFNWQEKSDLYLIAVSAFELQDYLESAYFTVKTPIYLPRVGCGLGELYWENVKPILQRYLDDRFVIVNRNKDTN
jgi:hypothetical protein